MIVDIKLPELGENITQAQVTTVMVREGDSVSKDQIIVEIETDKAVIEVPSEVDGIVKKVFISEGEKVNIGATMISVETSQKIATSDEKAVGKHQNTAESTVMDAESKVESVTASIPEGKTTIMEMTIPFLGEGIEKAQITQVFVANGQTVKVDQAILEMETDKATLELPTEYGGVVKEIRIKQGDFAKVGQVYMLLETTESKRMDEIPVLEPKSADVEKAEIPVFEAVKAHDPNMQVLLSHTHLNPGKIAPAAPGVRGFARQIGVNIQEVPGSGPGGRISMDDVKAWSKALHENYKQKPAQSGFSSGIVSEPLPDFSKWGEIRIEEMSNIRRKTADHLSYAWATVPQVTQFDKADITRLEETRKKFSSESEKSGAGKLTVTAILLKIIAIALKKFPQFNASIDMENKRVIYKSYFNIGVAVDTDRGLIVPVIRDVDKKSIFELSAELNEIAVKARNRKISLEEMQGGNFTISNLGGLGGTAFTPIVNTPEVAILGVSRAAFEPVVENGQFVPRMMLPLSMSYDHRIIDGADAVRFTRWICSALEDPMVIAMHN
ncbi:MAG TPA: branched-chain alpha-keto acid dehydrogenase subunit E2 [Saprospirales bacterium]|nr:branched-chain alpha-keto acid dehydrogenase subunit E2 [Saprospirales bacterium]HAY70502.1 branched-chain alpha-keto acid dehydrogenase subunit E2 [Saprospirales bacterium]HRQ29009.1 2-oxo acid dehydrogenase subunit E2 [Saprospiraceae bacterium]